MTIARSTRLGPTLFVLLGLVSAHLGYCLPLWRDRSYPPEFDTRIGSVIAGFAPLTTACAALAVYGYVRLVRLQLTSPSYIGTLLLILLALPVLASAVTGIYLAPTAFMTLPFFLGSLLGAVLGAGANASIFRYTLAATALIILLLIAAIIAWRLRRVRR